MVQLKDSIIRHSPHQGVLATAMKLKTAITLCLTLIIGVFGAGSLQAQTAATIEVSQTSFTFCSGAQLEGSLAVTVFDAGGAVINDVTPVTSEVRAVGSNGTSVSDTWDYLAGQPVAFSFVFGGAISYADLEVVSGNASSGIYRFGCDGTITFLGGGTGAGIFGFDGRINLFHGDLISALYVGRNADRQPTIRVYDIGADSKGILRGDYDYELFAPYLETPPRTTVRLGSLGRTVLYALPSGEFQILIGPDEQEGKVHEVTFTGLPPTSIRFWSFIAAR